nr:histidine kinase [Allomuricauda sp.]
MGRFSLSYRSWHFIFWSVYLLFKVYHELVWIYPKYESLTFQEALQTAFIAQTSILLPKVLFTYWMVYRLLPSKSSILLKTAKFFGALVITSLLYRVLTLYVALPLAYKEALSETSTFFALNRFSSELIDILFVAGIGTAIITLHRNKLSKEREKALENEKTVAELRMLRQQTNPHFLLNTLNNLYVLARKKSDSTSEAIMKLSKLMKYVLYDATLEKVPLTKEIDLIQDYIELERLRYGKRLKLNFKIEGDVSGEITPMLLHALVENAFKHGASESTKDSSIDICLALEDGLLTFQVENTFDEKTSYKSTGIGLKNLKRQLELEYPNHSLEIESSAGIHNVILKIQIGP